MGAMQQAATVQVALAQINSTVGALAANAALIRQQAEQAHAAGADILVTPELSLAGYPPEDLLLRPGFIAACAAQLQELMQQCGALRGLHLLVGHPLARDGKLYNAVSVLHEGHLLGVYCKQELPNNAVFDEKRYFDAGHVPLVFEVKGMRFGVNICEDSWFAGPPAAARAAGAQVLLAPNGSPFHMNKQDLRYQVMREHVSSLGLPLVYVNLVGGQDELVFDGGSFVLDAQGEVKARMAQFESGQLLVRFEAPASAVGQPHPAPHIPPQSVAPDLAVEAQVYQALVCGVRDYVGKNGFPGAIIGLSGGVDSALTLAVAVDALGAGKVRAVMMPSPYTAEISLLDSREMVQTLGVQYDEIAIANAMEIYTGMLGPLFAGRKEDTTEENIQARIRGTLLMALSNKFGSIVLTTGNKSEMAVGYCTLYGDMAGGFAVIKDLAKTLVYRVCAWRNAQGQVIPERILTRAPSAELRPNQTDQDSLPPYEVLDAIMQMFMEENRSQAEIIAAGYTQADVARVTRLIRINEYKRRQAPIGIRITHRGFGRDWRYPVTQRYAD
ncbi:NAD+ synthase [Massilia sp. W12]|uniref:NAD+ synthase n=1 Tax=Massilia sp. W12 TaxID=3126507 RepID=UPI0030D0D311